MKTCACPNLPEVLRGDDQNLPLAGLVQVAEKPEGWVKLFRCMSCGQHWQVDVWDKYQVGLCIKAPDSAAWKNFADRPFRLQFLVQSRGGTSEETCRWRECKNKALKGLAFCAEHAFSEMGLRA